MSTWNDRQVPRPPTGKTPVRNFRSPDDAWVALLARAALEGRTASDVLDEFVKSYGAGYEGAAFEPTFANWPGAEEWVRASAEREEAVEALGRDLSSAVGVVRGEWLTVAIWHTVDRYQRDVDQQKILAGHVIRSVTSTDHWREKFRDRRHLLDAVQAAIARHMPIAGA